MSNVNSWLKAFRLRTLPLSLSGILVGSFCALSAGFWNTAVFILALCTTVLFQILSNLANDLGDTLKGADNSQRLGPMRSVQSGEISKGAMKFAILILVLLSFTSAGLLVYIGAQHLSDTVRYGYLLLACSCILAAITYTMGKNAYGYLGLGDVFVFLFFGIVSVMGVYPLFANSIDTLLVLPAITVGCLSTMVLNLNNMRDHVNDANVGKRTLVVKIGFKNAKVYHLLLLLTAFICWTSYAVLKENYYGLIALLPFVLFFKHIAFVFKTEKEQLLDGELKKVALGTFLLALLFGLSIGIEKWIA